MSSGFTSYECVCGGIVQESWDSEGSQSSCDKCNHPYPKQQRDDELAEIELMNKPELEKKKADIRLSLADILKDTDRCDEEKEFLGKSLKDRITYIENKLK